MRARDVCAELEQAMLDRFVASAGIATRRRSARNMKCSVPSAT
jgi:hypothetical protein